MAYNCGFPDKNRELKAHLLLGASPQHNITSYIKLTCTHHNIIFFTKRKTKEGKRIVFHLRHGKNEKLIARMPASTDAIQPTDWKFLSSLRITMNLICITNNYIIIFIFTAQKVFIALKTDKNQSRMCQNLTIPITKISSNTWSSSELRDTGGFEKRALIVLAQLIHDKKMTASSPSLYYIGVCLWIFVGTFSICIYTCLNWKINYSLFCWSQPGPLPSKKNHSRVQIRRH